MYKLLKQNLINYKEMNDYENHKEEYRMRIAESLVGLVDKEEYIKLKIKNDGQLRRVENLVYEIASRANTNRRFERLSYELWAYGYTGNKCSNIDNEMVEEQLKLIEMFDKNLYII